MDYGKTHIIFTELLDQTRREQETEDLVEFNPTLYLVDTLDEIFFLMKLGGHSGRRGIVETLKIYPIPFTHHNINCIVSLFFWCKQLGLEDSDHFLKFLGSL